MSNAEVSAQLLDLLNKAIVREIRVSIHNQEVILANFVG
jgi:hypothetical protein